MQPEHLILPVTVPTGQSWPGLQSRHHHLFPALELLKNAIGKAGYSDKVVIGMDVAASEFYRSGKYDLDFKSPDDPSRYITPDELANLYKSFIRDYPGECPGRLRLRVRVATRCERLCHCYSSLLNEQA